MKKHNFNAGPSILPREVIEKTAQAILDFNGSGLSLMEISHRAKDFQPVVDEAVALFKELLNIPDGYSVLFLGGVRKVTPKTLFSSSLVTDTIWAPVALCL